MPGTPVGDPRVITAMRQPVYAADPVLGRFEDIVKQLAVSSYVAAARLFARPVADVAIGTKLDFRGTD